MGDDELIPAVGTALTGHGQVVEHRRVTNKEGKFFGLLRLVVEMDGRYPAEEIWIEFLGNVNVQAVMRDTLRFRLIILYKIPGLTS
jgi:hypothetical protein